MEKKLGSLPESTNEYWEDAEINMASFYEASCEHKLKPIGVRQVQCVKCGWGLVLDYEDEFKDGHLYKRGKLVI